MDFKVKERMLKKRTWLLPLIYLTLLNFEAKHHIHETAHAQLNKLFLVSSAIVSTPIFTIGQE